MSDEVFDASTTVCVATPYVNLGCVQPYLCRDLEGYWKELLIHHEMGGLGEGERVFQLERSGIR
jgi:hypothetical protein